MGALRPCILKSSVLFQFCSGWWGRGVLIKSVLGPLASALGSCPPSFWSPLDTSSWVSCLGPHGWCLHPGSGVGPVQGLGSGLRRKKMGFQSQGFWAQPHAGHQESVVQEASHPARRQCPTEPHRASAALSLRCEVFRLIDEKSLAGSQGSMGVGCHSLLQVGYSLPARVPSPPK